MKTSRVIILSDSWRAFVKGSALVLTAERWERWPYQLLEKQAVLSTSEGGSERACHLLPWRFYTCPRTCQLIVKMQLLNREKVPGLIMLVPFSSCADARGLISVKKKLDIQKINKMMHCLRRYFNDCYHTFPQFHAHALRVNIAVIICAAFLTVGSATMTTTARTTRMKGTVVRGSLLVVVTKK